MITDLRNTDFVSFHIKPSVSDETWDWIKTTLNLSEAAGTLTADGFVSCVDLGFVRVSDGSRYNEELHPSIEDKVVPVPGSDGNYYFGSLYREKQKSIQISYDSMTEEQIRIIRLIFAGDKKLWDIYFDEEPYKVYHVKISSPVQLNYICMDNNDINTDTPLIHNHTLAPSTEDEVNISSTITNIQRIYKGEGTINIKTITPFATERYQFLNQYTELNKNEWAAASRLKSGLQAEEFNDAGRMGIFNAGDVECDWTATFDLPTSAICIKLDGNENINRQININEISTSIKDEDIKIRVNSKLNLIEGLDKDGKPTGSVYNKYKKNGNFFKIPRGEQDLIITCGNTIPEFNYHFKYF